MTSFPTRRRRLLPVGAMLLGFATLAGSAAAQTTAQQNAIRANCRNDFMSYCSGVAPGGRDALACLQKNAAQLSPACRKAVSVTMHHAPAAAKTATAPAAATPPASAPRQNGHVRGALLIEKACLRYILRHCRGMGLDMQRKVACLVDYVNGGHFVGPRCRTVLKMTGHL